MGPFVDGGFDEAFRFAVGARRVGSGATVLESELVAGVGEAMGLVARAVIGEDASRNDAKPAEPAHGGSQEVRRTAFGLVRIHGREGEPGVVIDGDVQELGADAFDPIATIAGDPHPLSFEIAGMKWNTPTARGWPKAIGGTVRLGHWSNGIWLADPATERCSVAAWCAI